MADSLPFVATPSASLADLAALIADVPYSTAKVHLYSNDYTPDKDTVIGDLTETTFSGYAAASLTWGTAFLDGQKVACSSAGQKAFTKSGATSDNVYGAYITDVAGTGLLRAARLPDAPAFMDVDGSVLLITLLLTLTNGLLDRQETP